jgi:hypothetical protein
MSTFFQSLFKPVDASALAVLRIGFGALLIFNAINNLALCPTCRYLEPAMLFKYHHFEWVTPWPGFGLWIHWSVLVVCAIAITLGYKYRLALFIFTCGFTYNFLLDQSLYLNHYYMVMLFCFLMLFLPANCKWSFDARDDTVHSSTVPYWTMLVLLLQLEIILLHAGLVKLNADWLNLEPLRMWMHARRDGFPAFFTTISNDAGIALGAYGAIALHLIGAPLLFFRRALPWVLTAYAIFHLVNHTVFSIGIFPWFTWFASLLFYGPDWPLRFRSWIQRKLSNSTSATLLPTIVATTTLPRVSLQQKILVAAMALWLFSQALIPLRHWWLPGDVAWTEDGHRFSWRMKLRSKSGSALFHVHTADQTWTVHPKDYLNAKQQRKMPCIPDMVWQFAQFLEQEWQRRGHADVGVTVTSECSLNGRDRQTFIKPGLDLTSVSRDQLAVNWLVPLHQPLKNPLWDLR